MTGQKPEELRWDEREDLTPLEKEAVTLYLEYSSEVQNYLRHPREISGQEEWSWFQAMIRHLDDAIDRSTLRPGDLVFRGVRSDFTKRLLFLLSIEAGECSEDGFHRVTPHIIQDQGYTSFTRDVRQLFPGSKGDTRVVLVHQTNSSDRAIDIGGRDLELLYPRALHWMTTGFECISMIGARTILISLDSFTGGI
ncbi:MAG: ADP-ribosyltransferase [Methanoregulaceae archaeon]|nr:ADP-ribosyltransferase [Methanoregulaceae archaeon]